MRRGQLGRLQLQMPAHGLSSPQLQAGPGAQLAHHPLQPFRFRRNTHLDWSLGLKHVLKQLFLYPITRLPWFDYKHRIYGKGPLVEVSTAPFLLEPCREAREGQVPPAAESLASPEL